MLYLSFELWLIKLTDLSCVFYFMADMYKNQSSLEVYKS